MSGGSFNYLDAGNAPSQCDEVDRMAEFLEQVAVSHPEVSEVAVRTRAVADLFRAGRSQAHALERVWHAAEWWKSGDWSKEDLLKECAAAAEPNSSERRGLRADGMEEAALRLETQALGLRTLDENAIRAVVLDDAAEDLRSRAKAMREGSGGG